MLKDKFLESRGAPIEVSKFKVYQTLEIDTEKCRIVDIEFESERGMVGNGIVMRSLSGKKIGLSDGSLVEAVVTWDDPALPRSVRYNLADDAGIISIYPKYIVDHENNFVTE